MAGSPLNNILQENYTILGGLARIAISKHSLIANACGTHVGRLRTANSLFTAADALAMGDVEAARDESLLRPSSGQGWLQKRECRGR